MKSNMKSYSYQATLAFLGLLCATTVIFTLWAGNPPWATFRIIDILPWLPWTSSPYFVLAAMAHVSKKSISASNIVLSSSLLVGALNIFLMINAYVQQNRSGELWLAVPLYELLACIPVFIVVRLVRKSTMRGTPNQAL